VLFSAGDDGGRKLVRGRIANAKSFGWAIYAAGFAIWLFGYLSVGHPPLFDWDAATPWWVQHATWRIQERGGQILDFAQRRLLQALSAAWESGSQSLTID
jgi:hypothetical protein